MGQLDHMVEFCAQFFEESPYCFPRNPLIIQNLKTLIAGIILVSSLSFLINNNLTIMSALSDWAPTLWQTRVLQTLSHLWVIHIPYPRSHGEGNGNPLQYSCLENSTNRGAWQGTVDGVTKSRTHLSYYHSLIYPKLGSKLLLVRDLTVIYCTILSSTEKGS